VCACAQPQVVAASRLSVSPGAALASLFAVQIVRRMDSQAALMSAVHWSTEHTRTSSSPDDETRYFSYPGVWLNVYLAVLLIALAGGCIWLPFSHREGWVDAEWFMTTSFFVLLILFINVWLVTSKIEVNRNSISWHFLGWRWKDIDWSAVNHVRISFYWDATRRKQTKRYYIFRTAKPRPYFFPNGGMVFTDVQELERLVAVQAERWGIRVIDVDDRAKPPA
jgi:hypothetical protein